MILIDLNLQNFKKYTQFNIEFTQGLTGIIGKNGSGKSTIFESILFALYGELRAKGYKETIRNASASTKDHVVVELRFEIENTLYKIVREFRGKSLSATAKLFKNKELIVSGAKEVTATIVKLTKMSKDAFIHTLFASQKELTSLSTLKNEDRKKMIRKLLGLEKIDFIEKELIERSRQIKREIEANKEFLLSDSEVGEKKLLFLQFQKKNKILDNEIEVKNKELDKLKLQEIDIKKELVNFTETKEKRQKLFSSLELIKNNIDSNSTNHKKLQDELKQLQLKQNEYDKLKEIKELFIKLENDLKDQNNLKESWLKKEGLFKEQEQLRVQYKKSKNDIKELENECLMYDKHLFDANNIEKNISHIQDNIIEKQTIEKEILAEISSEQKLIDQTNKKISDLKNLGALSNCPTCTRPLLEEYDNVINSLNQIVENNHKENIKKHQIQLTHVQEQKNNYDKQLKDKQTQLNELTKLITIIQSKQKDLLKAKEYFKTIETKGIQNKAELSKLEKYSYDENIHKKLQEEHTTLQPKYTHLQNLHIQLQRIPIITNEISSIYNKIEELNTKYINIEIEYKMINYDEKKHLSKKEQFEKLQQQKENMINVLFKLKDDASNLKGKIENIKNTLENNQKHLNKLQTKKDDLNDYEKIKVNLAQFKTKLNSKIAPRISNIASSLYSTITKGKYQHIEVSSDFDFSIYDDGIKYPIERFSGGEVDLANLVLRIAISKTLVELNGASSVEFLAFDEVFGSQDEARRLEILEIFHTIKEQYRQIFLISHEIEIKEMFESVVEL
ncbi:MAG: SMC family ATPase [Campylobacterota bacterium]|nr:SMC family ATPase [Campylobacterota bacterium]